MLDLGPTKLLVIFIVVVVLLGPDKLPQVARQLGSGWRQLRQLHQRMEAELRQTVPDLPSTEEIARFARSPMSLLTRLSDVPDEDLVPDAAAAAPPAAADGGSWPEDPGLGGGVSPGGIGGADGWAKGNGANGSATGAAGNGAPGRVAPDPGTAAGDRGNGAAAWAGVGTGPSVAGAGLELPDDPSMN